MQLSLFGSTGRVGRRLIEYALAEGHTVRAMARTPSRITPRSGLEVLAGDVLDPSAVERTITGSEIVLSTLGGAGLEDPGQAQSQGMRNIVAAMEKLRVRRLLGVAGSGILDSATGGLRHDQPSFLAMFKPVSLRHLEAWHAMRDSALEWTMVVAPDLVDGARTGVYRTLDKQLPEQANQISVEDVADFMLKEMTAKAHLRRRVGIGY